LCIDVEFQLQHLRDDQQHMKAPPNVVYAQLKYMWANGSREESLSFLRQFSGNMARDLQIETKEHSQRAGVGKHKLDELSRLLARCYFKQGQWQVELKDDWGAVSAENLLCFQLLTLSKAQRQRYIAFLSPCYAL
jgi:FKBP12-rapamycin complex-associated protein